MKKNEKIIITIIIVLIIIICLSVVFVVILNHSNISELEEAEGNGFAPDQGNRDEKYDIEKLRNSTMFYTVENCIKKSFNNNSINFNAKKMDVRYGNPIETYRVYGVLEKDDQKRNIYYIVRIDRNNSTYEAKQCRENYNSLDEVSIEADNTEIPLKEENQVQYERISTEALCREYLRYFINLELDNPEEAYELLEKEYRDIRFGNLENFKNYIEENKEKIRATALSAYSEDYGEENTRYVLKDTFNNYYTIEEESIMNFTVKLENSSDIN